MYVSTAQKTQTILIAVLLVVAIPLITYATYLVTSLIINASQDAIPKNIVVANVTSTSATVTYFTDIKATGSVTYSAVLSDGSVDATKVSTPISDLRESTARLTHFFEITGLEPDTVYLFEISSNGKKYNSENDLAIILQFITSPLSEVAPVPSPVYGSVQSFTGDDAIIYLWGSAAGSETMPLVSSIRTGGNWISDLSGLVDASNFTPATVDKETELSILVVTGDNKSIYFVGKNSEIFDDSGKLLDSVVLAPVIGTDNISNIPAQAYIGSLVAVVTPTPTDTVEPTDIVEPTETVSPSETAEPSTTPSPIDSVEPSVTPTPSITPAITPMPSETPTPIAERQYRIFSEPVLVSIPVETTSNGQVVPDVYFGEESVQITNITDTRFSVVWLSDSAMDGFVKYGTVPTVLDQEARDSRDGVLEKNKYFAHQIDVIKLQPETKYYFEIHSGTTIIKNVSDVFEQTTFATLSSPPPYKSVSGKIINVTNPNDSVVVLEIADKDGTGSSGISTLVSTVPSNNGTWIASIGDARTESGSDYFNVTTADELTANLIAYVDSVPVTKVTDNLDAATITVAAADSAIPTITKISPLATYQVYSTIEDLLNASGATEYDTGGVVQGVSTNSLTGTNVLGVSTNINGQVLGVSSVPKTGKIDLLYIGFGGLGLIGISGFLIFKIASKTSRKNKPNSMKKVLSV